MENNLGFRLPYLRQLIIRQFRCSVFWDGEAATIKQTYPDAARCDETNLARHLGRAVLLYLSFDSGRFGAWSVREPVPADDPDYGMPNSGTVTIFNAFDHDSGSM